VEKTDLIRHYYCTPCGIPACLTFIFIFISVVERTFPDFVILLIIVIIVVVTVETITGLKWRRLPRSSGVILVPTPM
jgi:hypothetical protein